MPDSVTGWQRTRGWHPRLTLVVTGPSDPGYDPVPRPGPVPALVLDAVAEGLDRSRFSVKDRTPVRFRARYVDWFAVASGSLELTRLAVEVVGEAGGARLTVDVLSGQEQRAGRRNAVRGLGAAVADLRSRGLTVTIGPWTYPGS